MTEFGLLLIEWGLVLVLGFAGAQLLKKLGVPQVLGFLVSGIIFGLMNDEFTLISIDLDHALSRLVTVGLGIIGFNIGAELRWKELKKVNRKLVAILAADSIGTFLIVTVAVYWFTDLDIYFSLILGALASATAPAATADVLWEYKSAGPLTQAVLFILAVDDILSILLVQISASMAESSINGEELAVVTIAGAFLLELVISISIGAVIGLCIVYAVNRVHDHASILELIIGALVLVIGLSLYFEGSAVLACMVYGFILASLCKQDPDPVLHDVFKLGSPVVALFFIVVGTTMKPTDLFLIGGIGVVYLVARTLGKVGAVSVTAKAVKAPRELQRYLGFCLFSQAGVALGLAAQIYARFSDCGGKAAEDAKLIFTTITGTVLIVQLVGPLLVKWSVHRAKEVGCAREQLHVAETFFQEGMVEELRSILDNPKRSAEQLSYLLKSTSDTAKYVRRILESGSTEETNNIE